MRTRLTKGGRSRLYVIRPGEEPGEWYAQVFFNGTIQHRSARVHTRHAVDLCCVEFRREVTELQLDGWVLDPATK